MSIFKGTSIELPATLVLLISTSTCPTFVFSFADKETA